MIDTYITQNKLKVIKDSVENLGPWLWPTSDVDCWKVIKYEWEQYHSKKWFQYIKNFDVVLQAGGCCGLYPRLLSTKFKQVYTFEPDPLSFHCLVHNCQLDHIIKLNIALGNNRGLVSWAREDTNIGMNKVIQQGNPCIPMMKIDDLCLHTLDLLALDIEGYETEAIKGAINTITKLRPVVISENGSQELMATLGYVNADRSGDDIIFLPIK